jgi:hypothetical protein
VGLSKIYFGAGHDYENEICTAVGKDVSSLHVGAQRVAWALLLGERVGIDVDACVKRLLAEWDDEPMAHVTVAIARIAQGRTDEGAKHLDQARERMRPDHPWSLLVTKVQGLTSFTREATLVEEVPGRIYRIIAAKSIPGIPSATLNVATFVRVKSGALACINPVAMDDDLVARVRALGDVTHVVAPSKYHNEQLSSALEAFPGAKAWGVPAHAGYAAVKDISFAGFLDDDAPLFPGEIDQITMRGVDFGDVWFVDRPSSTLLVTDAFLVQPSDEYSTPFGAFYQWAWGIHGRPIGIASYQPPMWQDLSAYQGSIRRALAHDFENLATSHGAWRCTDGNAKAELSRALGWFLSLDRVDGLRLVGDFFWRHPGVTIRFAREQLETLFAKRKSASGQ